ncbi:lipopolysaccharide heptosyltransferase family protein [Candidatus Pelagibacter sp.]|nr:lipopolysaccharide heptosyltransferase family protein [Candidatus Pelagibacter sp.]
MKTLDLGLKYFGFRWWHFFSVKNNFSKLNLNKFDLIIDLQSKFRNTIILKKIPNKNFYSSTLNFTFCTVKKKYLSVPNIVNKTISNLEKFLETKIQVINLKKNDLDNKYIKEAEKLLPNNKYIGISLTQGNLYRKKSWPIENFIELAKKIEKINKTPVFFIEKNNHELINKVKSQLSNALFPEHNSNLSSPALVTALSERLELAISIDNGVMHMISLANIPMIVLFGPTNSEKFAPNNKNTIILDSKNLYNSDDISKIKIQDVMKYIN